MAKVKAPLLSLGASGKLGNTLVGFTWKGIKCMREYVVPANPQTADQTTQRDLFSASVYSWRNYITNTEIRDAWNREALASGNPQSGFNKAMSSITKITATNPAASYAVSFVEAAGNIVNITMKNIDDNATGDEAGNFEVWVGNEPSSLLLVESVAIAAGVITTSDLGDTGDIKYVQLRKDDHSRSGIMKCTLIA